MKCQEIRGHNIISTSQHHNDNDRLEEGLNHFLGIVEIAMEWKRVQSMGKLSALKFKFLI